jgi:hypothetical protein
VRGTPDLVDLTTVEQLLIRAMHAVPPRAYEGLRLAEWREATDALAALDRAAVVRGVKLAVEWAELHSADNEDLAELQASLVCVGLEFAEPEWLAWCLDLNAYDYLTNGSVTLAEFAKTVTDIGARHERLETAHDEFLAMRLACPE